MPASKRLGQLVAAGTRARRQALAVTLALLTACGALAASRIEAPSTPAPTPSTARPTAAPMTGFVRSDGTRFILNGERFRFTGLNLHQAMMTMPVSTCAGWAANRDLASAFAAMGPGIEVVRVYALQTYVTKNGARDWSAFDRTVAAARAQGLRLIVTLVDQWAFCEGPYKDQEWYRSGYQSSVLPNTAVPYREFVGEVAQRYKDEPAIMLWELANEPQIKPDEQSSGCPPDALAVMLAWAHDVSSLVKALDPNHLVSIGTGTGWCGLYDGDYQTVHALPTLDACSYHEYGGKDSLYSTDPRNGLPRRVAQCHALNKPLYVGEAGIKVTDEPDLHKRAEAFDRKIAAQFELGVEGFLVWKWANGGSRYDWEVGPRDPLLAVLGRY